jgi:chromosome segregation ATPase
MDRTQFQEQISKLQGMIDTLTSSPVLHAINTIAKTEERIREIEERNAALIESINQLKEKIENADQHLS